MPSTWFSVVVECDDPVRLANFWCPVLGYQVVDRSEDIVDIAPNSAAFPGIEFIRSAGHERRTSSLHLDLNPADQEAEVARVITLGARRIDVGQPPDASWVVLADPEGNAFCVLAPQTGWTNTVTP
ncbi:MAG: VOC family protein [Acidimicrobiia bacterium]